MLLLTTNTVLNYFKRPRNLRVCLVIFVWVFLAYFSLLSTPHRFGDGWEYLGMTISIATHGSPDLRASDIEERRKLVETYPNKSWTLPPTLDHAGYFKALNGNEYSYHFWLYSALCAIPYLLLKSLGVNPLKVFQLTNSLLFALLLHWIIYRKCLPKNTVIWLCLLVLVSPVLFYIPWSHPEVFIFVFTLIGLIELVYGHAPIGTFFLAIASTQSPPILIVSLYGLIYHFWQLYKKKVHINLLALAVDAASLIMMALPYAFYWVNFKKLSLIAGTFATVEAITFSKFSSLFIDPNFGMIVYVPVLLAVSVLSLVRKDILAITGALGLIAVSVVCSTQLNWNCGMMYIHRYGIWMLPISISTSIRYVEALSHKRFIALTLLYTCTTSAAVIPCLAEFDDGNYLRFGPLAKVILSISPGLYNPPFEVFAERTIGFEGPFNGVVPKIVENEGGGPSSPCGITGVNNHNQKEVTATNASIPQNGQKPNTSCRPSWPT